MFRDFDFHPSTGRLVVEGEGEVQARIVVHDLASGECLGEVPERLLALRPRFSPDGEQVFCFGNGRIYRHSLTDDSTETLVDIDGSHAGFSAVSPDAGALAFSAYKVPVDPKNNPPSVFLLDLASGKTEQVAADRHSADRFPQWSPTSRSLAFGRGFYGPAGISTGVVLADRTDLGTRQLSAEAGRNQSIGRSCWSHDGAHILATESFGGTTRRLAAYRADTGDRAWSLEAPGITGGCFDQYRPRVLCTTDESLGLYEFPSGKLVAALQLDGPPHPALIRPTVAFDPGADVVYFLGQLGRVLRWNVADGTTDVVLEDEQREAVPSYEMEEYWFTARDGRSIPVQMYAPRRPNGRVIVYVQGGPGPAIDPGDPVALRLLDEGYQLIRPAYRGTAGYGDEHARANQGEWGRTDVWDIVDCAIDWVTRFDGDSRSLGLAGFSYGGFLTFLASTYPESPWSCAITLWGATRFLPRFLTLQTEELERAASERSPIARAGDIRVPLLMLHGGRDTTAATEDVESIRDSVHESGVPRELVVFEEDNHGLYLSRPEMFHHMLEFLDSHLA